MTSFRKAINDKCKECIYDEYDKGTWRQQVGACTSPDCPLFSVRPIARVDKTAKKVEKRDQFERTGIDPKPTYRVSSKNQNQGEYLPDFGGGGR